MRLDLYLVNNSYFASRQKAVYAIKKGIIAVNGKIIEKSSFNVKEGDEIKLMGEGLRYVSRGGLKLLAAIDTFQLDVKNKVCLDLGASTGGFTQCLLEHSAKNVIALDVGINQLAAELRNDSRVTVLEKFNARNLSYETLGTKVDMVTSDLSFISQTLIYEPVTRVLMENCYFVSLIKPQFEAGKAFLNKKGVITDLKIHDKVIHRLIEEARKKELYLQGLCRSPIQGGDGNKEYLALFCYKNEKEISEEEIHKAIFSE